MIRTSKANEGAVTGNDVPGSRQCRFSLMACCARLRTMLLLQAHGMLRKALEHAAEGSVTYTKL
jgi:hypothetical protein